jgi:hypothetical protein
MADSDRRRSHTLGPVLSASNQRLFGIGCATGDALCLLIIGGGMIGQESRDNCSL